MTFPAHHHGLRRTGLSTVLVLAATLLASCASVPRAGRPTDAGTSGPSTGSTTFDPTTLVGSWTVDGADDERSGTVLQVDTALALWRACGEITFSYIVGPDGDLHVGGWQTAADACRENRDAAWLVGAVRVEGSRDVVRLLAADGTTTATLHRGGTPQVDADAPPGLAAPPVLTPELRDTLEWSPLRLPEGVLAATAEDLVAGRWVPVDPPETDPDGSWAEFAADGTWKGTDGCNQSEGLWVLATDGELHTTSGATTLIGCDGVAVNSWITAARMVGTSDPGGSLILFGDDGTELGRLVRAR